MSVGLEKCGHFGVEITTYTFYAEHLFCATNYKYSDYEVLRLGMLAINGDRS